ncbi:uncharacterized protein LOC114519007 [Dendronephthya gigantea]|uniref:uncharacterized protein LOC114519007 n=1 Tax=Dendronephthya gigantea TaxID=151771 RepID=UPI00106B4CF1|nr:uncharacterized protein LOC114519007 [Dendronephthya gigantea]
MSNKSCKMRLIIPFCTLMLYLPSTQAKSSDIRIVGGKSDNEGRVEVYYKGQWGTVCDDFWDMNDARVVCRQLGFQDAEAAYKGAHFGEGTGKIWLDDVKCKGDESSLFLCKHRGWGRENCDHDDDAGVRCKGKRGYISTTSTLGYNLMTSTEVIKSTLAIQPSSTERVILASSTTPYQCGYNEYQCRNGRCIDSSNICDGRNHCFDGSDEVNCPVKGNFTRCQNKLDLGFILDSSGSVGYNNFERMKQFVKDFADFYKLGREETRISVMSFSSFANIRIRFSTYFSTKSEFDNSVDRIPFTAGGTATSVALNLAYNSMFTAQYGARGSEFKKVMIILTDGRSNTGQVSGPSRQLKNSGVVIFSVGIGQSLSMQELREMASDPVDQHVITLNNFTQLASLSKNMSSQTCDAYHFQVFCDNDYMTAVFDRKDFPKHVNVDRLYLLSRSCKANWNSTHVIVKTQLTGCGTVFTKDDQTLYFSNTLSEMESSHGGSGSVSRNYLFTAAMTCSYPRKRTVGSFSFAPAKESTFVVLSAKGNFTLTLGVFKGGDYRESYTSQDYPVAKSLSDNLYIQYSVNTSNLDLVVRAETCRATPTNRPYDTPQYVFIDDGCDKDETIRHYSTRMSPVQRFSIQAFRFLSQHRFVYLHCDLVVCYGQDSNSTCARSTSCLQRYRRAAVDKPSDDASRKYALSFGPLMHERESTDKTPKGQPEINITLVLCFAGFGCLCLILIGALFYMIKRSRKRRSTDELQTGVKKKEVMSMKNLGFT